jgi:hypothetical protein
VDDIISYHDVVTAEKASLRKGMNYGVGKPQRLARRRRAPFFPDPSKQGEKLHERL